MALRIRLTALALILLAGCKADAPCARCDVVVVAATGEPRSLLPPLVVETVGRDISDQVFERLADLDAGAASIDTNGYRPRLAARWERVDPLTLRFHLRPNARWHDGEPVTADDVVFSFEAFRDTLLDTPARTALDRVATVTAENPSTVAVRFTQPYPEQLFDATQHVRVFPAHLWRPIPRDAWAVDTSLGRLAGSGPYRIARWERGQALTLVADTVGRVRAATPTAVWRFASDPEAALNLVLAGEADLLETVGSPERVTRVEADSTLRALRYPAAVYGYLGYRMSSRGAVITDPRVRQALNMGIDRAGLATAIFGPGSKAPPGPMSQLLWTWDDSIAVLPFDTAGATRILTEAGWVPGRDGMRQKSGRKLSLDILVPATSLGRKRLAEALQEQWRQLGVSVTITALDFPVFMERLGRGNFESYIGAWLDGPSPRGVAEQWTSAGVGQLNFGRYASPTFDRLVEQAGATTDPQTARLIWREAFDTLNADAPALFLYAPVNVAAVSRRVEGFDLNPYSWLSGLPAVRLKP
jgi:peptide/nickel transport system substrate-binding protein